MHPDCVAAVDAVAALLERVGHTVEPAAPEVVYGEPFGAALGPVMAAAVPWIVAYWVRELGREPGPGDLEPMTAAYWEAGKAVSAAAYLSGMEELQRVGRAVARFLTDYDVWLTPTLAGVPPPLGELRATPDDQAAIERVNRFVAFPGVLANVIGCPAMSVPTFWTADGLPVGTHFLGRFGDEATLFRLAAQLEDAVGWRDRRPPVHAANA